MWYCKQPISPFLATVSEITKAFTASSSTWEGLRKISPDLGFLSNDLVTHIRVDVLLVQVLDILQHFGPLKNKRKQIYRCTCIVLLWVGNKILSWPSHIKQWKNNTVKSEEVDADGRQNITLQIYKQVVSSDITHVQVK